MPCGMYHHCVILDPVLWKYLSFHFVSKTVAQTSRVGDLAVYANRAYVTRQMLGVCLEQRRSRVLQLCKMPKKLDKTSSYIFAI